MDDDLSARTHDWSGSAPVRILSLTFRRGSAIILAVVFAVCFAVIEPGTFFTMTSLQLILSQQVVVGMLALGVLLPLVTGNFDLSIGGLLSLSQFIVSWMSANTGTNLVLVSVIAVGACAMVGWINGFVVVRLRVNSFIATLAMSEILSAFVLFGSSNTEFSARLSPAFISFGQYQILGIPIDVLYLLILAVIAWYVLEHTPAGRYLYATGGNAEAARLAGVNTARLVWTTFVASAAVCGVAGVILVSSLSSFSASYGQAQIFPVFAAVFFGATQIKSRPNAWGTLVALYALAIGVQGIELKTAAASYWVTPLFDGLALLIAVALASRRGTVPFAAFRRRRTEARQTPAVGIGDEPVEATDIGRREG